MVREIARTILGLPQERRWAAALVALNLGGSLYGFQWYASQLARTPWWQWPVVPDSPLSTLLFSFFLVFWYWGRSPRLFSALALLGMLKYGAWTMFIFGQIWWAGHGLVLEDLVLFLSHLGMVVEALIFVRHVRLPAWAVAGAAAWYVINDWADYGLGFRPGLPAPEFLPSVAMAAVVLTVLSTLTVWLVTVRRSRHV